MQELLEWMEYIEDKRQQRKVRHTLKDILVIVLFATLAKDVYKRQPCIQPDVYSSIFSCKLHFNFYTINSILFNFYIKNCTLHFLTFNTGH